MVQGKINFPPEPLPLKDEKDEISKGENELDVEEIEETDFTNIRVSWSGELITGQKMILNLSQSMDVANSDQHFLFSWKIKT